MNYYMFSMKSTTVNEEELDDVVENFNNRFELSLRERKFRTSFFCQVSYRRANEYTSKSGMKVQGYAAIDQRSTSNVNVEDYIIEHINIHLPNSEMKFISGSLVQITGKAMLKAISEISDRRFNMFDEDMQKYLRLEYAAMSSSFPFELRESFIGPSIYTTKASAKRRAKALMGDRSLYEELERIYDPKNKKAYMGNPVHYVIHAENRKSGEMLAEFLLSVLQAKNRLPGSKLFYMRNFHSFEICASDEVLPLYESAEGNAVMLELNIDGAHAQLADVDMVLVKNLRDAIQQHKRYTLSIFLDIGEKGNCTSQFIEKLDDMVLIHIHEGEGNIKQARELLDEMLYSSDFASMKDNELYAGLVEHKQYPLSEIQGMFDMWYNTTLRRRVYGSYKNFSAVKAEEDSEQDNLSEIDPEIELQDMIGLKDVKDIINQIILHYSIQQKRKDAGLKTSSICKHLLFTGNPGSAKTTVARLIARILYKKNITQNKNFVECGRRDLIGEYVGHTAPKVKRMFQKARGGVLFIDEAYSLADNLNHANYSEECIATIVQEMENARDSTIVIFAGYKKPMEAFLNVNEGLRSRIAFKVDFPDYNSDELVDILKLMGKQRQYSLTSEAVKTCRKIFQQAINKDNFGNGRFVRNLLEGAIVRQSQRLATRYGNGLLLKETLMSLKAEDFNVKAAQDYVDKTGNRRIGF